MMTITTTIAVTAITPLTHINHFHSDELIVTHHIITTTITVGEAIINNGNVNVIMLIRVIMNIIKKMIIKVLLKNLFTC